MYKKVKFGYSKITLFSVITTFLPLLEARYCTLPPDSGPNKPF